MHLTGFPTPHPRRGVLPCVTYLGSATPRGKVFEPFGSKNGLCILTGAHEFILV